MSASPAKKPPRSVFDRAIDILRNLLIVFLLANEISHIFRMTTTVAAAPHLYARHNTWSSTFPFVGSYFLMKPEGYDSKKSYPLVVALHGVSSRIYAAEALASPGFRKSYPVFVMVPVAPQRAFWATPKNREYQMRRNIPYPDHLPQVMAGIDQIINNYPIDKSRIYIVGHSMGASGVVGALERYPDRFAAGIASAGTWDPAETAHINDPLWLIHGSDDRSIPFEHSRILAAELRARGLPAHFNALAGRGHDIGPTVFAKPELWKWLLSQKSNAER